MLVFITYSDNVMKKTIYHRKNKPRFLKKKKKNSPGGRFFAPPWENPGYGPAWDPSFTLKINEIILVKGNYYVNYQNYQN